MNFLLFALAVQFALLWDCAEAGLIRAYQFTHAQKRLVVKAHNRLRRLEGAADMQELVWDEDLARLAYGHASTCNAWHRDAWQRRTSRHRYVGENIWWSTERYLRSNLDDVIVDFYNEKPYYTYGSGYCQYGQQCGHYTAVVWSSTCSVGCAASYCNGIANGRGINHGHIIVCNYGPGGNAAGQLPFIRGRACSQCPNSPCHNGLCASQCAGTSFFQIPKPIPRQSAKRLKKPPPPPPPAPVRFEISSDCVNNNNDCDYWARIGECTRNPDYMHVYCKKACSVCKKTTKGGGSSGGKSVVVSRKPPSDSASDVRIACVNQHALCTFWQKLGECKANPAYMLQMCTGACNEDECKGKMKTKTEACKDEHTDCGFWAGIGECAINPDYMHWKCQKTCKEEYSVTRTQKVTNYPAMV